MRTFRPKYSFLLLFLIFFSSTLYALNDYRPFELRKQLYFRGDMKTIGNTALVAPTTQNSTICNTYTNGAFTADAGGYNNDYYLCGYQTDPSSATQNSTTSELILPTGATVKWAGLYWQALVANDHFSTTMSIKIKKDSGSYNNFSYDNLDYLADSGKVGYTSYSAFKDITYLFNNNSWGEGNYTVADIPVHEGKVDVLGTYGAWSLVVVYEDLITLGQKFRSFSIFDGWEVVKNATGYKDVKIDVSGFYTPKTTPISANISIFAAEGDKNINGDLLKTVNYNNTPNTSVNLTPTGYTNQTFNSSISGGGVRTPNATNNMGIDIQSFDIGNLLTTNQTDMEFHFTSTGDTYWPSLLAFSTELYAPVFCYDYAYSQQGIYFTENNDGTQRPRIQGNIEPGEDISVKVFIKNEVASDVQVINLRAGIQDINTTQATYTPQSVKLAHSDHLIPVNIDDSNLAITPSANNPQSVNDIYVGEIDANDYFYVYYKLSPHNNISDINMSLNVTADYNITIGGTNIPAPTLSIQDVNIEMCANTDFAYMPAKGIFNIVHNQYYDIDTPGGTNQFYNIPTQVTNREGNFKVISLDPDSLDTLKEVTTIAAVEMIDASAFHDTNASCQEQDSAITNKVWVIFDTNTTSTPFDQASGMVPANFYSTARQNTAFRISYNLADANGSIIKLDTTGGFTITNFDSNTTIKNCFNEVGTVQSTCVDTAPMSVAGLNACMECMYGLETKMVCSRDNFAIRPEAFRVHLDDQNQTQPTSQTDITFPSYSGVFGAIAPVINLAADYNYSIEVNASNHKNITSSFGYTKSFNDSKPNDISEYTWQPRDDADGQGIINSINCNDDTNQSVNIRFVNGKVDTNTSAPEVGKYRLNILDTTWTTVDSNETFMNHHRNTYFHPGDGTISLDCSLNSSTTRAEGATVDLINLQSTLNGCNISSSHSGSHSSNLKYNDYSVTFHPYKFIINNTVKLGLGDVNNPGGKIASTVNNPFMYMNNIDNNSIRFNINNGKTWVDENMSVHFDATITATGRNGTSGLTNFIQGCYAKPLDLNISKSSTVNSKLILSYRYHDYNSSGSEITANALPFGFIDHGNEDVNVTLTTPIGSFAKDLNGTLNTKVNINYNKEVNASANPEKITFIEYRVIDPNNLFYADLTTNKKAEGNVSIDQNVSFYYGRTAAKKTRQICDTTNANCDADEVFIYYEVYCHQNTNNNWCNNAILPKDINGNSLQKVDTRWFQSLDHNMTTYGEIINTVDLNNPAFITLPNGITHNTGTEYISDSIHRYQINNGLPYTADMNDTVPNWLIHDEHNASAVSNSHTVVFRGRTEWSGEHEADSTTKTDRVKRVNRRTMW